MSRATPMTPESRRQAIIEATLPLLLAQGPEVSTREIATAAGIAEGTVFRAFETKHELIHATIHAALQPDVALAELARLPVQSLSDRVAAIFDVLRAEIRRTRSLFAHLFGPAQPGHPHSHSGTGHPGPGQAGSPGAAPGGRPQWPAIGPHESKAKLATGVAAALEPYAEELVVPAPFAAQALLALAFATSFSLSEDNPLNRSEELAQIVLYGLASGER